MLRLNNITKDYHVGSEVVHALRGVDIFFRKNEFVSILGPSGCGKTTLLNIIGGLDQYTDGNLFINGKSTKKFKVRDWDTYRNHSIGFVFQNYNLIPHQTVLSNVELALTLSGVSKEERRKRAIEALKKVGLGDQLKKKPTQMSGGQMQRVAIARALINNPDILLADEPTGALDSVTSVQIMDLLAEIAKEKLVIMVTHNAELAEEYSTRIIRLHDGLVIGDNNPFTEEEAIKMEKEELHVPKKKKKSMSFFTALSLSFNNLMTKKGRTILTSFAGSIGIIGIALILSLSNGINNLMTQIQEDTLSAYPITIQKESVDLAELMNSFLNTGETENKDREDGYIYSNSALLEMLDSFNNLEKKTNNLKEFKTYVDSKNDELSEFINSIQYSYDLDLNIYLNDGSQKPVQVNPNQLLKDMLNQFYNSSNQIYGEYTEQMAQIFDEIAPGMDGALVSDMVKAQYQIVEGKWPTNKNEIVLIVNENNEINDVALYALGIKSQEEFIKKLNDFMNGNSITSEETKYTYKEIMSYKYSLVLPTDYYHDDDKDGVWELKSQDQINLLVPSGEQLQISGIIKPNPDATATSLSGSIAYTYELEEWYINEINKAPIVIQQKENKNVDVFTGREFSTEVTVEQRKTAINKYLASLSNVEKANLYIDIYTTAPQSVLDSSYEYGLASAIPGVNLNDLKNEEDREELTELVLNTLIKPALQMQMPDKWEETLSQVKLFIDSKKTVDDIFEEIIRPLFNMQTRATYKAQKEAEIKNLTIEELANNLSSYVNELDDDGIVSFYELYCEDKIINNTYENNMVTLGVVDLEDPSAMNIYAKNFAAKEKISNFVNKYNSLQTLEENKIEYTDYVALIMGGVSTIINVISYVLIGFVSISLVVSSIMIGIITYISVLERTKEIGVLRAIGASKRDVSRVFNAETLIVGLVAGLLGVLITVLLCIPISELVQNLTGMESIRASLPPLAGVILVLISMFLTFIAGLIPAHAAAKKDPVEALRTE